MPRPSHSSRFDHWKTTFNNQYLDYAVFLKATDLIRLK
jgi:hypothetical protein